MQYQECEVLPSEHCVCKNSCSAAFFGAALKDMRDKSCMASAKQRQEWAFEAMKLLMREEDGKLTVEKATETKHSGKVKWTLLGTPVCRPFWNWCYQVSGNTASKLRKLVIAGAVTLPTETIPRMPTMRSKQITVLQIHGSCAYTKTLLKLGQLRTSLTWIPENGQIMSMP